MKIEAQWTVYRDPQFYSSFPSIVTLDSGECFITFRRGRESRGLIRQEDREDFTELCDRVDHLDSRSQLVIGRFEPSERSLLELATFESDPLVADQDPSLLYLGGERIMLGSFSYYHIPRSLKPAVERWRSIRVTDHGEGDCYMGWGTWIALSEDGGRNWSKRRWLPRKPEEESWPALGPHNSAVLRGSGVAVGREVLWATYGGDAEIGPGSHCRLYRGDLSGRVWRPGAVIATDAEVQFYEPALYKTPSGRLIAFMRTGGLDDRIVTAESRDLGASWETWRCHNVVGHPVAVTPMSSGKHVLMVYGYRHRPFGVKARLLDEECRGIEDAKEITIYNNAPNSDIGYPWVTAIDKNRAIVVYYVADDAGIRGIEATLIDTE